jgi:hypothetical protein
MPADFSLLQEVFTEPKRSVVKSPSIISFLSAVGLIKLSLLYLSILSTHFSVSFTNNDITSFLPALKE